MSESERHAKVSSIFLEACALPRDEQESFLDRRCANDGSLRAAVRELLAFDASDAAIDVPVAPRSLLGSREIPERIGPFKIEGMLGEGGMGVVYRASQEHPARTVAVKVVRPERATPELRRRFEYEAQALARLHHPAIAPIFEAGSVDTGRGTQPYFAMELVEGAPLPVYAAARHLDLRARLALLARVCDGVQHAHRNGVIHRDLKPANVLVDEDGQPRILDFGVARIADVDADRTEARTTAGELLGTLAYMSPEQARGDPDAVDARTDVYALGVMAYELLAGHAPLALEGRSLPDAARAIAEEEPTRLGVEDSALRGDVETIVTTAMAKDPAARYQSAEALGADIRRWLDDEPIQARPASLAYQMRKFTRRNRALVVAALGMVALLVIGTAVSTTLAVGQARARSAATRAAERADLVRAFFLRVFEAAAPEFEGPDVTVVAALRRAQRELESALPDLPEVRADIHHEMATTFRRLTMHGDAAHHARESLELRRALHGPDHRDTAAARIVLAATLVQRFGDDAAWDEADRLLEQAAPVASGVPELRAQLVIQRAYVAYRRDDDELAERLAREVLALPEAREDPTGDVAMSQRQNLAMLLKRRGRYADAIIEFESLLDARRALHGDRHPETINLRRTIAGTWRDAGDLPRAEAIYRDLLPLLVETAGSEHQTTIVLLNELAFCLKAQGRYAEAAATYRDGLERVRRGPDPDGFVRVIMTDSLALTHTALAEYDTAASLHAECIDRLVRDFPGQGRGIANSRFKHADVLLRAGRVDEALDGASTSLAATVDVFPGTDRVVINLQAVIARAQLAAGRSEATSALETVARGYDTVAEFDWLCERSARLLAESCAAAGEVGLAERFDLIRRRFNDDV